MPTMKSFLSLKIINMCVMTGGILREERKGDNVTYSLQSTRHHHGGRGDPPFQKKKSPLMDVRASASRGRHVSNFCFTRFLEKHCSVFYHEPDDCHEVAAMVYLSSTGISIVSDGHGDEQTHPCIKYERQSLGHIKHTISA
jgi:hypothetical protein